MITAGEHISDALNNVVVQIESVGPNDVSQVNWNETLSNLQEFAMSMDSAASVTQAYINIRKQERQKLNDFITTALTATESGTNIYSEEYKKLIKNLLTNLKLLILELLITYLNK